jgi:predicted porin
MMTLKNLIAGIALMAITPLAMAAAIEGIYIAADLGRSTYQSSCNNLSSPYTGCKGYDFSQRVTVGYQINPRTAAEVAYYSSGKTTKNGLGTLSDTIDSVEWQVSGVRYFPLGPANYHISALGRLGITHWEASEAISTRPARISASGNDILWGIGGMLEFTPATAVRLQYDSHKVGNDTTTWQGQVRFLSVGVTYQF